MSAPMAATKVLLPCSESLADAFRNERKGSYIGMVILWLHRFAQWSSAVKYAIENPNESKQVFYDDEGALDKIALFDYKKLVIALVPTIGNTR